MKNFNLTKVNVLVVERQLFLRQLMREILHALGVAHVSVSYADELFDDTNMEYPPDMIFTDWSPGLDGIDLIKTIRGNRANLDRYIPVVVVSAFTDLKHVCQARDAGMTEYLTKPVSGQRLYQRISAIVKSNRDFIRATEFFGPDRRRRDKDHQGEDRRGKAPAAEG